MKLNYLDIHNAVGKKIEAITNKEWKNFQYIYQSHCEKEDLQNDLLLYYYNDIVGQDGKKLEAYIEKAENWVNPTTGEKGCSLVNTIIEHRLSWKLIEIHNKYSDLHNRFKIISQYFRNTDVRDFDYYFNNIPPSEFDDDEIIVDKLFEDERKYKAWENKAYKDASYTSSDIKDMWEILEANLSPRDLKIIQLYVQEKTEREIAKEVGLAKTSVHKIITKILNRAYLMEK